MRPKLLFIRSWFQGTSFFGKRRVTRSHPYVSFLPPSSSFGKQLSTLQERCQKDLEEPVCFERKHPIVESVLIRPTFSAPTELTGLLFFCILTQASCLKYQQI